MARESTQKLYDRLHGAVATAGPVSNAEALGALMLVILDLYRGMESDDEEEDDG